MVALAEKCHCARVRHLDHGETLEYLKKALDLGFTSVMYDGSALPYEEKRGKHQKGRGNGQGIRRQCGSGNRRLGKAEGAGRWPMKTTPPAIPTPLLAERFVKDTGVDALACSFGMAHGTLPPSPSWTSPDRKIHQLTGVPLVMHGGSGVSPEDYVEAIKRGVRKINYYTYMAREGTNAAKAYLQEHPRRHLLS